MRWQRMKDEPLFPLRMDAMLEILCPKIASVTLRPRVVRETACHPFGAGRPSNQQRFSIVWHYHKTLVRSQFKKGHVYLNRMVCRFLSNVIPIGDSISGSVKYTIAKCARNNCCATGYTWHTECLYGENQISFRMWTLILQPSSGLI